MTLRALTFLALLLALGVPRAFAEETTVSAKSCVRRLAMQKTIALNAIDRICAGGAKEPVVDCVGELSANKSVRPLFKNPLLPRQVCEGSFDDREKRDCIVDHLLNRGISHLSDAQRICAIPVPAARACVVKYFLGQKKYGFIADAELICQYRSLDTRDCLLAYTNEEAPFNLPPDTLEALFGTLKNARPLCEINSHRDRACVLKRLLANPRLGVAGAYGKCASDSKEIEDCVNTLMHDSGLAPETARQICSNPTFEVRACIVEKMRTGAPKPIYSSYESICQAEFMKNLMNPLDATAHGVGCKFKGD